MSIVLLAVTHYLKNNKAEFHTYQLPEEKSFRIVIKNLNPTTTIAKINHF